MIEVQLDGCIYEVNFRYNDKMKGYTKASSDMNELYDIPPVSKEIIFEG